MTGEAPAPGGLRQFIRFGVVGVANTLTTYLVILLLTRSGVAVGAASLAGYAVGTLQSFVVNRRWTFAISRRDGMLRQAVKFVIVNIVCGLLFSFIVTTASGSFPLPAATVIAVAAVLPINYSITRLLVFKAI